MASSSAASEQNTDPGNRHLKEVFTTRSLCALAIMLPGCWMFAAASLIVGIFAGGPPVEVWGSLAVGVALSIMCLSLAEFASAFPSAAGCTHIASQLAGPRYGRIAGYLTGYYHSFGVLFTPAALVIVLSQMTVTCAELFHADFVAKRWHIFLVYETYILGFMLILIFGTRVLPLLNYVGITLFVIGFVVTICVLLGLSPSRQASSFVFSDFTNGSGFDSDGYAVILGLTGTLFAFGPPHWLLNMAEDVKDPQRSIPIALGVQQCGNILTLFIYYVAIYFAVPDFTLLAESTKTSIVGALYLAVTERPSVALVLLLLALIPSVFNCTSYISAAVRLLYGFTRSGSVPKVHWWAKINDHYDLPLNAVIFIMIIQFLLGFVYLGSVAGFNIVIGSASTFYAIGYLPVFIPMIINGRKYLSPGPFFLPWAIGMGCAIFTASFQTFALIAYCLPTTSPVNTSNLNWSFLFVAVATVIIAISWIFHGRAHYTLEEPLVLAAVNSHTVPAMEMSSGTKMASEKVV